MRKISHIIALCIVLISTACNKNDKITNDGSSDKKKENAWLRANPNESFTLDTLRSGVVVSKKGDDYFWQGDILLSATQLKALDEKGSIFTDFTNAPGPEKTIHPTFNIPINTGSNQREFGTNSVGVYPTPYNLWSMVRYTLAPDLTWDRKYIIDEAIAHWEANTNIRFYNATGRPTSDPIYGFNYPYVEFVNSDVNKSYIGRIGGRQTIQLAQYQDASRAIHEIGHAIGLYHEQCRIDRDNYLNVNINNVDPKDRYNFDKVTDNYTMSGSMDFNSIMMYGSYDFAVDYNIPVLTRKDGTTFLSNYALSEMDKNWANTYYLPYKPRYDTYRELDAVVYKPDNTIMTDQERLNLQAQLNNGNPNPPYSPPIESAPIYYYYNQDAKDFGGSSVYYPNGMWGNWKFKYILGYGAWDPNALPDAVPVYRYYNEQLIDNYYITTDLGPSIPGYPAWQRTDITFWAFSQGGYGRIPIYAYVSTNNGHHALSVDVGAVANLSNGLPYNRAGIVFWVYPNP